MSGKDSSNRPKRTPTGDYDNGYCRPPLESRWKKGTSGNPGGRPKRKKKRLVEDIMRAELNKMITLTIDGKEERITVLEAVVKRQINDLLSASATQRHRAFNRLLELGALSPSPEEMMPSAEARAAFLAELARLADGDDQEGGA